MLIIMSGLALALVTSLAITGGQGPSPLLLMSAITALPWGAFAMLQWRRMTPGGQRTMVWAGVAMVLAMLLALQSYIVQDKEHAPANMLIAIAVMGGLPFALGVWRTFRG